MEENIKEIKNTCIKAKDFLSSIIKNPRQQHSVLLMETNINIFRLQVRLGNINNILELYGKKDSNEYTVCQLANKTIKNYPIKKIILYKQTIINLLNELDIVKNVLIECTQ